MVMIERVARAINAGLVGAGPGADIAAWEAIGADERHRLLGVARRALLAMRDPSTAMLADGGRRGAPADAANVWERMLFRALYEES